ncbi:hypothetical protein Tco_0551581 [Tanacetum coccineum]
MCRGTGAQIESTGRKGVRCAGRHVTHSGSLYVAEVRLSCLLLSTSGVDPESEADRADCRFIKRTSLSGFPAQSVSSSNVDALDSSYLLVLLTGTP